MSFIGSMLRFLLGICCLICFLTTTVPAEFKGDRLLLEAFEGVKFAQLDRKGGSIKAVRSDGPRKEIIV